MTELIKSPVYLAYPSKSGKHYQEIVCLVYKLCGNTLQRRLQFFPTKSKSYVCPV